MATLASSPDTQQARKPNGLYERDFYSWAVRQGALMRRRDFSAVDWENVIEEIEALARAERRSVKAYCARMIEHLLKIDYWDYPTRGVLHHWADEVQDFRQAMAELIDENPGLKGQYDEILAAAWKRGRFLAVKRLKQYDREHRGEASQEAPRKWDRILPKECPYRLEHVTAFDAKTDQEPREDVWPPSVARILNAKLKQNYPILPDYKPEREGA